LLSFGINNKPNGNFDTKMPFKLVKRLKWLTWSFSARILLKKCEKRIPVSVPRSELQSVLQSVLQFHLPFGIAIGIAFGIANVLQLINEKLWSNRFVNPLLSSFDWLGPWKMIYKMMELITFQQRIYHYSIKFCSNCQFSWLLWPFLVILLMFLLFQDINFKKQYFWCLKNRRFDVNSFFSKARGFKVLSDMRFVTSRVCKLTIGNCSPDRSGCSSGPFRPRSRRSRTCCSAPWR
jgi:hypothetical protein